MLKQSLHQSLLSHVRFDQPISQFLWKLIKAVTVELQHAYGF